MTGKSATWGLLIATAGRSDILKLAIELALNQTRPPVEIIVVDCSPEWEAAERAVRQVTDRREDVRVVYQHSAIGSLTVQRNQGLQSASTDILFCFDDDTLMFPNCAERM